MNDGAEHGDKPQFTSSYQTRKAASERVLKEHLTLSALGTIRWGRFTDTDQCADIGLKIS